MNFKKAFSVLLLVFALALVQTNSRADDSRSNGTGIDQWANSPAVDVAPNGDWTSPYPPYYHPDK